MAESETQEVEETEQMEHILRSVEPPPLVFPVLLEELEAPEVQDMEAEFTTPAI